MKKILLMMIFLLTIFPAQAHKTIVRIAYEDKEQPPYYMQNSVSVPYKNPGVSVEMILLLEKYIPELDIQLERMPWKRCTYSLGINAVDGIFNSSYMKERLEIGQYPTLNYKLDGQVDKSKRLANISYFIYANKKSDFKWNGNLKSIKDTLGAPNGYSIVNELRAVGIPVEEAQTTEINLLKVQKGRLKAVALQEVTADAILKNNKYKYSQIKKLYPPLVNKEYYLMLSHDFVAKHPNLAQKIWNNIRIIHEREYPKLLKKY